MGQETKKRTEPVLVPFDGPFREPAHIAQVGTEEFEFSFGVRQRFPRFLSQELSLTEETTNRPNSARHTRFPAVIKEGAGALNVETVLDEIAKLEQLRALGLPEDLFWDVPAKLVTQYRQRAGTEWPRELRRHPLAVR